MLKNCSLELLGGYLMMSESVTSCVEDRREPGQNKDSNPSKREKSFHKPLPVAAIYFSKLENYKPLLGGNDALRVVFYGLLNMGEGGWGNG